MLRNLLPDRCKRFQERFIDLAILSTVLSDHHPLSVEDTHGEPAFQELAEAGIGVVRGGASAVSRWVEWHLECFLLPANPNF